MNYPKTQKEMSGALTQGSKSIVGKKVAGAVLSGALFFSQSPAAEAVITTSASPALPYPGVADPSNHNNANPTPTRMTVMDGATCSHASGIVNGHFSGRPAVNTSYTTYNLFSHGNHSNHSNHCSCSRWM